MNDLPSALESKPKSEPYIAGPGLIYATDAARRMDLPLLLTGEPGCGKTQAARWMREQNQTDFAGVLRFNVKTTSSARELFYRYDAIRHYRDAQRNPEINVLDYIHFNALGQAIIASALGKRYIVLIDEIDKAPRDFPNDLLYEIENMAFSIEEATTRELRKYKGWKDKLELQEVGAEQPEISKDNTIHCGAGFRPFVLLTSNSEKNLPDAFMRRCAYHHINFPDSGQLTDIIRAHGLYHTSTERLLNVFDKVRNGGLRKKPGTAELLVWLKLLTGAHDDIDREPNGAATEKKIRDAFVVLAKNREDASFLEERFEFPTAKL